MSWYRDRATLEAFRRGEQPALLVVYRAHVAEVVGFLQRGFSFQSGEKWCRFRGFRAGYEVEAAVQEVFRRAFEVSARLAYNGLDPFEPYLLRIARNLVINDLKAKQPILFRFRSGAVVLDPGYPDTENEVEPGPSQEALLEAQEVWRLVNNFKGRLTPRERGVFEQRFEHQVTSEAAAQALGLSRSQVRTTESKLRAAFLAHMQSAGYFEGYGKGSTVSVVASALALLLVTS